MFRSEEEVEINCSICMSALSEEVSETVLECGHEFHLACVEAWLEQSRSCPYCRAHVEWRSLEEIEQELKGISMKLADAKLRMTRLQMEVEEAWEYMEDEDHNPTEDYLVHWILYGGQAPEEILDGKMALEVKGGEGRGLEGTIEILILEAAADMRQLRKVTEDLTKRSELLSAEIAGRRRQ